MEDDRGKVEKVFLHGAMMLVFELKAGAMTTSCFELAAELGKMKDVFFNKVSNSNDIKYQPLCNL